MSKQPDPPGASSILLCFNPTNCPKGSALYSWQGLTIHMQSLKQCQQFMSVDNINKAFMCQTKMRNDDNTNTQRSNQVDPPEIIYQTNEFGLPRMFLLIKNKSWGIKDD